MTMMNTLYIYIDRFLIGFYRISDVPIFGYLLGTAILGLFCVVLGQFTLSLAYRANRRNLNTNNKEMVRMHNLSIYALLAKNKKAYKSCNKESTCFIGDFDFCRLPYKEAKENTLLRFNQDYVSRLLTENQGNVTQAARQCGLERQALQQIMRRYGIKADPFRT